MSSHSLNRRAAFATTLLLAVVVAYQVAQLGTSLYRDFRGATESTATPPASPPLSLRAARGPPAADLAAVAHAHLFGEAKLDAPIEEPPPVDAPDTTLKVKLTGILFGTDAVQQGAIMVAGGKEQMYRAGQPIEGAEGTTLRAVYADRVLVERSGVLESVRLLRYADSPTSVLPASRTASTRKPGPGAWLTQTPPNGIPSPSRYLSLTAKLDNGHLVALVVSSGADAEMFEMVGLQDQDVITHLNGARIGNNGDKAVFAALSKSGAVQLTVQRGDSQQVVVVDPDRLAAAGS